MLSEPSYWSRLYDYGWALLPYWWLLVTGVIFAIEPLIEAFIPSKAKNWIEKRWPGEPGAMRTPVPAQGGQQSGDCGQQVMAA